MTIEFIAKVCHEVNRAYCEAIGDHTQVPWDQAPEWQKESAVKGVEFVLANPSTNPSDQHKAWMEDKAKEGWVYGPVKDAGKKTHPCMVPYESLPLEQRVKDHLFQAVIRSLANPVALPQKATISLSSGDPPHPPVEQTQMTNGPRSGLPS